MTSKKEKARFPQIPSTVWWGVRSIVQKTPKAVIDERLLGVQLDVQAAAARQYIKELREVGILDPENRPTPLANKWRLDDSYSEAVDEIISRVYPEGLVHIAPPKDGDRQKIISWFERAGMGKGSAGNKAASYLLIGSPVPNESAGKSTAMSTPKSSRSHSTQKQSDGKRLAKPVVEKTVPRVVRRREEGNGQLPLNLNVQIHISADAGSEQIESIFAAMRRYLYDASDS